MIVKFQTLTLENYKSHRDLQVNFGEVTKISGDNAKGKSSILEAITFLFYGTDTVGSKVDPTPITYEAEETKVSLFLSVDEKNILLGRGLKKGKAQYYINEVPSKAKEFTDIVEQLFDKELFLSLFNPSYFFTLHWEKQRAMLLQYVSAPARKEVFKHLPETVATNLEKYLKKHSLEDLEKIHKDNKNKKDKSYIASQSRTKTLQEQLSQLEKPELDIDYLKAELAAVDVAIQEIEKVTESADDNNRDITLIENEIDFLEEKKMRLKEQAKEVRNEPIAEKCSACGQALNEEAIQQVKNHQDRRVEKMKPEFNETHAKWKELKAKLSELEYIDVSEQLEKVRALEQSKVPLQQAIHTYEQYERLETQVRNASADENGTLQDLNASIFILDSIKAFRAKEAELQGEKVQALFTSLSIKLFEELKNGEVKPTFEIEMDGKGYRKLSLSEGIRAGLELRDVLSKQSELIAPCFVDNAESITSFKQPNGQLIIARVVAGQDLKVEVESE